MKSKQNRVRLRTLEAKVARKRLIILMVKPAQRIPFPDKVLDKLFGRYKAGVFIAYQLLPRRKST